MKNLTYESNRLWEEDISRQRLKNLISKGYPVGEPHPEGSITHPEGNIAQPEGNIAHPEGNIATPQPFMGLAWVPSQMRWTLVVASNYVNGMVFCHELPFGAPIQGQFGPSPGPFYPGAQPFRVPFGFQPTMDNPPLTRMVTPSYPGPNSGSNYNPGTFGANSGQSLGSSIHPSPDLSRRSIATRTTTTTITTSTSFRGTLVTPMRCGSF